MSATRLKRYRHFPSLPDARALVALLRLHGLNFETRYVRGTNYDRARHEPDRLEVWVRATDYAHVQQLETALTREQAIALADNALPDEQLLRLIATAPAPPTAPICAAGGRTRKPRIASAPAPITDDSKASLLAKASKHWRVLLLLLAAGLAALAYVWLK